MAFWVSAALFVGSLILGEALKALRPKPKPAPFEYPTADEDAPIPIGYGTFAIQPNIIGWGDTETADAEDHTAYYARMIAGLCYGEVDELVDVLIDGKSLRLHPQTNTSSGDDEVVDDDDAFAVTSPALPITKGDGTADTIYVSALDLMGGREGEINSGVVRPQRGGGVAGVIRMHWGTSTDGVDTLTTHLLGATKASAWPGVAYLSFGGDPDTDWTLSPLANGQFYWGLSPSLPTLKVLLRKFPTALLGSTAASRVGDNANAAEVIYDLLTNPLAGAGVDTDLVDTTAFTAAATTLASEPEYGVSLLLTDRRAITDVIDDICRHVDATVFRHPATGKISITLMRESDASVLTVTTANSRNPRITPPTVDDTTNEVRVAYRGMNGSTSGTVTGEVLTTDYQDNGMKVDPLGVFPPTAGAYYQLRGRNVSDVVVTNTTQAETIPDNQVIVDGPTGIIFIRNRYLTGGLQIVTVDDGDTLTASYTATPTEVGFKDAVTAPEHDLANIELTGSVRADTIDLPYFTGELAAKRAAQRSLRKLSSRLEPLTMEVNRQGHVLVPGSVITVTLARLGLTSTRFRVSRVTWGALDDGWIPVEAVRDVFGTSDTIGGIPGGTTGTTPSQPTAPVVNIACVSPGAFRVGLFASDTNFTIKLWVADSDLGAGVTTGATVVSDEIAGTETYYDYENDGSPWAAMTVKYFAAQLIRPGYADGPLTNWMSCTASEGTPGTPTCTLPSYTYTASTTGTPGTVTLTITDSQVRVTRVRYRTRSGNGGWTAWALKSFPYTFTVVLVSGLDSHIEWEIDYTDCAGVLQTFAGSHAFLDPATVGQSALTQSTDSVMIWQAGEGESLELDGIGEGRLAIQYSLDGSTGFDFVDGVSGPYVPLSLTGARKGDWAEPEAAAKAEVCYRLVTVDESSTVAALTGWRLWKNAEAVNYIRVGAEVSVAGSFSTDPVILNAWMETAATADTVPAPPDPDPPDGVDAPPDTWPVARGLLAWHIADHADNTYTDIGSGNFRVSTLADLSGNANHLTGSTGPQKPSRSDASVIATQNGRQPVSYFGNADESVWPTDLFDGVTEAELFIVVRAAGGDPNNNFSGIDYRDYCWTLGPGISPQVARWSRQDGTGADTGGISEDFGSSVLRDLGDAPGSLAGFRIYNVRAATNHFVAALDGTVFFTTGTNTVAFSSAPSIGPIDKGTNIDIAEIVIHSVVLTTEERALCLAELQNRWGL